MSDFDDRAGAAGDRVRATAESLAASTDPLDRLGEASGTHRAAPRSRRRLLAVACVAVVALGVGGLVITGSENAPSTVDLGGTTPSTVDLGGSTPSATTSRTSEPSAAPTVTTASTGDPAVPGETTPPTDSTTTPPPSTAPEPSTLVRPIIDPEVCEPSLARMGLPYGLPRHDAPLPFTLFSRPGASAIQIIGDPTDGQAKPFAVVMRHVERETPADIGDDPTTINGADVRIAVSPDGDGEAEWMLADGSQGFMRSRGLDQSTVESVVAALSPRPVSAAVPGFDYEAVRPDLVLVDEQLNTDTRAVSFAGSECTVPGTGAVYRISAVAGDPAYTFGAVIDRSPPVDVGVVGDTTVVISGRAVAGAPTIDDVVSADTGLWDDLLAAADEPAPTGDGQPIGGDLEATVDLVAVDPLSTPPSSLIFRVDEREGVSILEIHTREAVIADDGEYWQTEIDGRMRGLSGPPHVGSVMGTRLWGDQATEPFTVRVSTVDGDGFTIQTTGDVLLVPTQD